MTIAFSGRQTISTTSYSLTTSSTTLAAQTTSGIVQLVLGLKNMVAGDAYRLQIFEKVLSDSVQYAAHSVTYSGAQSTPNVIIPAAYLSIGWDFTLTRLAGTDRVIEWSIRQVAVT